MVYLVSSALENCLAQNLRNLILMLNARMKNVILVEARISHLLLRCEAGFRSPSRWWGYRDDICAGDACEVM